MSRGSYDLFGRLTLLATAAAVTAAIAQPAAASHQAAGDLTGVWVLNEELSDDAEQVIEDAQRAGHEASGRGGHRRPGSAGGHGPGMHGGRGRGGADLDQMRTRMWLLEPPGRLTITQTDSSITFTDGDGRSQTLATTNRKERVPTGDRTIDVRTRWDGEQLVKEAALGDGMKLTETYTRPADTRQLLVVVRLEGSHVPRPVTVRRVYDAEAVGSHVPIDVVRAAGAGAVGEPPPAESVRWWTKRKVIVAAVAAKLVAAAVMILT